MPVFCCKNNTVQTDQILPNDKAFFRKPQDSQALVVHPHLILQDALQSEMMYIAIEIIKELPITLILRPFNFETFATKAYANASQDLLEAAALPSLFIIFWSALLIFYTSKHILSEK